jgi:hypothetical protein
MLLLFILIIQSFRSIVGTKHIHAQEKQNNIGLMPTVTISIAAPQITKHSTK